MIISTVHPSSLSPEELDHEKSLIDREIDRINSKENPTVQDTYHIGELARRYLLLSETYRHRLSLIPRKSA